ncbi:NAD(P)H-dependent flavin oxidoreductase YrpB (nitropropane dioxygenase family) [Actinoplanes campanulatus]|uniref:NAD(P)H-dependent flavin oxidoreductase YrpB (Nitropropane dioxygenase family) n=1 Tax=Actinoplanes campanulatus TaxID=113559 RepID=A0A7W5FE71_9ACTN|nr:nitronate monooxygenase [Actinoplanes campanulatus]MBB3095065.1 NAD(P)H-dependent flavin oxidoreductase YrpB (nitropropane dioxygenase family) [Actinoplanes campanulatus]GGN23212.1 putative 2-nitropropane dioxygenase [Actinoplanes campanulatus]GID34669.1 putative 2-nitropropane dioxygenase [Actinoplanes campanulatus]
MRTALTELLGCRHPIVQTGMGYVAGARLVSAVAAAGGFGIVASATMSLEQLRDTIHEIKDKTDQNFGVNVRADAPDARARIELLIREKVRLASFALAPDRDLIRRCADGGVLTMPSVGAVRHAEKVAGWGVDAVLVQGGEGGGHTGPVPTTLLLPRVVDAVGIPVVAAGGFFDGRGLLAALAYGAAGIAMGTRFLLTADSPVGERVKRLYLDAPLTGTVVTTRVDGVPHRVLRTPYIDGLENSGRVTALLRATRHAMAFRRLAGLSWPELVRAGRKARHGRELTWAQTLMAAGTPVLLREAMVEGRPEFGVMSAGQVAGVIDDLPSCAELIERIVKEASEGLDRLRAVR